MTLSKCPRSSPIHATLPSYPPSESLPTSMTEFQALSTLLQSVVDEVKHLTTTSVWLSTSLERLITRFDDLHETVHEIELTMRERTRTLLYLEAQQKLLPMRLHNCQAAMSERLKGPNGWLQAPAPLTREDLLLMTSDECNAAAAALGISVIEGNALVRRQNIAEYLGVILD
ncbi:hypothetical protein BDQ12DRAFT_690418 [Crucibulum laeve]|uniref:Uncharacterized protein n=1 Tax=Crucibulum laeve TaxID=68775 RepID=A0A5C3LMH6_9AGAR|nr:hypothetical protein BDQ12DRAFT_690418 [Crucibulum laeve]